MTQAAASQLPFSLPFQTWYYRLDAAVARDSDAMRLIILHYHLFKNAGSTVEEMLDHSFRGQFRRMETSDAGGILSDRDLLRHMWDEPEARAVSSHQIRYPMPQAFGYLFFDICFVRDPLDRLRSFYDYFRERPDPANPVSRLANQCGLGEFAARMIREQPLFVRNNQVNLLACGGDSDDPGEHDLAVAIRRIQAAAFPGVVDLFEQSVAAGASRLRQVFPELDLNRPPVNVTRGMEGTLERRIVQFRDACGGPLFEQLMRITALDRRLLMVARMEVHRRFQEIEAARHLRACAPEKLPPWLVNRLPMKKGLRSVFDSAFYLQHNPDVRAAGIDPLSHYLTHGAAENRAPHALFDPHYYRASAGSALPPGANPLEHFLDAGAQAPSPHPLFSCDAYRRAHPVVVERNCNPLAHYLRSRHFVNGGDVEIQNARIRLAVREDEEGHTYWTAEPQQLPFLRAVPIDQMRANSR